MLASIDVEVGKVIVVDNSMTRWESEEWDAEYLYPISPLGYGGAINAGIMQTPDAPWWMWTSNDVEFHPGFLATVIDDMKEVGPRIVTGGFTWAAVNAELIDTVGLVDEWSFFPIYYDDNDYQYRCKLAGVEWEERWATGTNHGDGSKTGSMAINSDNKLLNRNHQTFEHNKRNYIAKWGGEPRQEVFKSPWNTGYPVWYTKPSIRERAARVW